MKLAKPCRKNKQVAKQLNKDKAPADVEVWIMKAWT